MHISIKVSIKIERISDEPAWILVISRCQSGSIAVYRPQAELFGGRSDGKFGLVSAEIAVIQLLISAGDNCVGVILITHAVNDYHPWREDSP